MFRRFTLTFIFTYLLMSSLQAQIPNGTIVEDFTMTDINGNTHTLYEYLEEGKTVFIDVFATWCGPCWTYHNSHAMADIYEEYGPDGLDVAMVFAIDGSSTTTVADIFGTGGNTIGDWTVDTPYPMFDNTFVAQNVLDIGFYPTIFKICPIEKRAYVIGQQSAAGLYNQLLDTDCSPPFFSLEAPQNTFEGCEGGDAIFDFLVESPFANLDNVNFTTNGLPNGMQTNFSTSNLLQPDEVALTVSNLDNFDEGDYPFEIIAQSDSREVIYSAILKIIPPDIEASMPMSPADGTMVVSNKPNLTWEAANGASNYQIELATTPNFGTSIMQTLISTTTNLVVNEPLTSGEVYYWRVKSRNSCNEADASNYFAFQVPVSECTQYISDDLPVVISAGDASSVTSGLDIEEAINFDKIEIALNISHTWPGDLKVRLYAPDLTSYTLFDRPGVPASTYGCSSDNIIATFSETALNSAADFENTCNVVPPAISGEFQPMQNPSDYTGDTEGLWFLRVDDSFSGDGGQLAAWNIKFCENIDNSEALTSINNNLLPVPFSQMKTIENVDLQFQATDGQPEDVEFLLTALPTKGMLYLNGNPLSIFETFTQQEIENGALTYLHSGAEVGGDTFHFNVESPANYGWIPNQLFEIQILENSMSGTTEIVAGVDCFDNNTGSIEAQIMGGNGDLTYSIDGTVFQNENLFENLPAGNYTISVMDAVGFVLETNEIILENPTPLGLTLNTNDFDITANGTGGTGNYSYSLDGNNFQNSPEFTVINNGDYTIYLMDENGCMTTQNVNISVNTLIVSAAVVSDASCFNGSDGSLSVMVNGGTPPYQYTLDGFNYQSSNLFENVSVGFYLPSVLDAEGFTLAANQVTIGAPDQIVADFTITDFDIEINASGGTGDLEYSLDMIDFQPSPNFTVPVNGNYLVHIQDANGCIEVFPIIIAVNTLVISAAIQQHVSCFDAADGILEIAVGGGTPPLQYSLNGVDFQDEPIFENLSSGTYQGTVVDAEGFTQMTDMVTIENPELLEISATSNDFEISATAVGGTGNWQYSLDGMTWQVSNIFTVPANGTYTMYVQDANNCEATTAIVIAVNTLVVSADLQNDVICFGENNGSLSVMVNGGTPPFQYSLNGIDYQNSETFIDLAPGTYQATVLDAEGFTLQANEVVIAEPMLLEVSATNNDFEIELTAIGGNGNYSYSLDGQNFQPENLLTAPANGEYTLIVQDENGCTATTNIAIAVNTMVVDWMVQNITCPNDANGQIEVLISGGTSPFLYAINGNAPQVENIFSNLDEGVYQVEVTDGEGFTIQTLEIEISNPLPIGADIEVIFNQITVATTGGTGDLMYSLDGINFQAENVFTNVPNGIYQMVVMDENGCQMTAEAEVNIIVNAQTIEQPVACADEENGSIEVLTVEGGVGPFQYTINHGAWQDSPTFENLAAGTYSVSIIDANGFEWELEVILDNPSPITFDIEIDNNTVIVNAAGGTGTLMYRLDGGEFQNENAFTDVPAGSYDIEIMDENGCTVVASVIVNGIFDRNLVIQELALFPNPARKEVTVSFTGLTKSNLQLSLLDVTGRKISTTTVAKTTLEFSTTIHVGDLPNGIYTVLISDEENHWQGRLKVLK